MNTSIGVRTAVFCAAAFLTIVACSEDTTAPAAPATLAFTSQPANDTVGQTLASVAVTARDAQGAVVTGFSGSVTLTLGANPGNAVLAGTRTIVATNGVATFVDLALDKAEDGYTLTASAGTLTATSAAFDVSEVVTRPALQYYWGFDLETAVRTDCDVLPCPATHDFYFAYYAPSAPHAWFSLYASRQIATLTGSSFASVHLADTAGATFAASGGTPFLGTNTFLIRTNSGNVYKVGNPTELGVADSVGFMVARLN